MIIVTLSLWIIISGNRFKIIINSNPTPPQYDGFPKPISDVIKPSKPTRILKGNAISPEKRSLFFFFNLYQACR